MGQYIFLTGLYLPKPGATGMCIHQLAKECAKRGKDVTTICYADGDDRKTFDGVKIQKIHVPFFYQEIMSSNKIKRCINRLFSLGSKMLHIWNYPLRSKMLVNRYCKAIEMTIIQNNKATIVASVNPIEAVIAAGKMKQKYSDKIRIVYYCADTLSNEKGKSGLLSEKYRTKCGNKWEKKLFSMFDKVLIMECHRKHYYTEEYQQFIPKMHIVNFPLLTKPEINIKTVKDGKIRFVYAGTLYKELRNPSYLCEILVQLSSVMPIEVIFIGSGDCDDILDEACQRAKGAIKRLGFPVDIYSYIFDGAIGLSVLPMLNNMSALPK